MKRITTAGLLVVAVLALSAAATAAPTDGTATATTNNSTAEELRERVETLETKNAELKTKVTQKNGEIQKLEFELEQAQKQTGFSPDLSSRMRELGAWNPYENEPALLISLDRGFGPVVYQYVGPGNGDHSFNGQTAWTEVAEPTEEVREEGNFSFSLEYARSGMNTTYTVGSFGGYRTQITELENQLNTPMGFTAYSQWTNQQRQRAERFRGGSIAVGLGFMTLFGLGLMWVESQRHILYNRRRNKQDRQTRSFFSGRSTSRLDQLKDRFGGDER